MEGRAIARPDEVGSGMSGHPISQASMEGRAIARPDGGFPHGDPAGPANLLQWRAGRLPGRTSVGVADARGGRVGFNGGPGDCPAGPARTAGWAIGERLLQWRAGRLPGRTPKKSTICGPSIGASMEGRAIARPDQSDYGPAIVEVNVLQWRAGRLPGRTLSLLDGCGFVCVASMEGRAIARPDTRGDSSMEGRAIATPCCRRFPDCGRTSMEGRAIARPDPGPQVGPTQVVVELQWRAGRLPGRTSTP